jgi:hypothetical protein
MTTRTLAALALALGLAADAGAQRVLPHPVTPPPPFLQAVANGTRTLAGAPGPAYWQNTADYDLRARVDTDARTLDGAGTVTYTNHSPDSLAFLVLKLRQNVHAPGVPRNRPVAVTGGLTLDRLLVDGEPARDVSPAETPGSYGGAAAPGTYVVNGTVLTLGLADPLAPGETVTLEVDWSYPIPPHTGTYRQGTDGEVFYVGYWYPQVAVYDDVAGWHTDPYLGLGEHYMGYGDYRLEIDAPAGWLLWSTGDLENPDEVLTARTRERLDAALAGDAVVAVVSAAERGTATASSTDGRLVWRFAADGIRDVAFALSDRYVWDATRALVDRDGDGEPTDRVLINALYRPAGESPYEAPWERAAEFSRFSVEHLSETLWPYPWPHMTAVEGLIGGGMEYPMMTLIGGDRDDARLFGVTYHEIAHMWYPMMVGANEKAFTWMDEGLTSFMTNEGVAAFFDGSAEDRPVIDAWDRGRQSHYALAGTGLAVAPMRHNDRFPIGGGTRDVDPVQGSARVVASYSTPAVLLHALRGLVGEGRFYEAFNAYGEAWVGKHPYPYDLLNAFETALGQDLDWLWTPTLFETWTVDHAVASVEAEGDAVVVTVEDQGRAPMPAPVRVTYADGRTEEQTVPVERWLAGATEATLRFPAGAVVRVEIDPDAFTLDADRTDNVVEPGAEPGGRP